MKSLVRYTPPSQWTGLEWANYLGCPFYDISRIKKIVGDTFKIKIMPHHHNANGACYIQVFYRPVAQFGRRKWQMVGLVSYPVFANKLDAICFVNNNIKLQDKTALALNIPPKAVQMAIVNEKQKGI